MAGAINVIAFFIRYFLPLSFHVFPVRAYSNRRMILK